MSKAFTRESDEEPVVAPPPRPVSPLPPGAKNYITPAGAQRLREELAQLTNLEQPALVSQGDDPEAKSQLQTLEKRVHQLQHALQSVTVLPPPEPPWDTVRFGATVTVQPSKGDRETYRIVGIEETDLDRDWVSFLSPIAKALLNARLGERVRFKLPAGERELEIVAITYE